MLLDSQIPKTFAIQFSRHYCKLYKIITIEDENSWLPFWFWSDYGSYKRTRIRQREKFLMLLFFPRSRLFCLGNSGIPRRITRLFSCCRACVVFWYVLHFTQGRIQSYWLGGGGGLQNGGPPGFYNCIFMSIWDSYDCEYEASTWN